MYPRENVSNALLGQEPSWLRWSITPHGCAFGRMSGIGRNMRNPRAGSLRFLISATWWWWKSARTTCSHGRHFPWQRTTAEKSSERNTMPGRTLEKAKAAFLGKATSLLLPRVVDELSSYIPQGGPTSHYDTATKGRKADSEAAQGLVRTPFLQVSTTGGPERMCPRNGGAAA